MIDATRSGRRRSVKARDLAVVRRGAIAEVEHDLVDVTPSPAFGPIHLTEAEIELMGRRNVSVDWVEPMLEADLGLYPIYAGRKALIDGAGLKNVTAWGERVGARPGVQKGMRLES
jgi:hypothetical protein